MHPPHRCFKRRTEVSFCAAGVEVGLIVFEFCDWWEGQPPLPAPARSSTYVPTQEM